MKLEALYWHGHEAMQAGDWNAAFERFVELERHDAKALISSAGPGPSLRDRAGDEQAEALIEQSLSAPSEQAAPQLMQIVEGEYSAKIKRRALFVLSQQGDPGSLSRLVAVARGTDAQMRSEAIQMLGVSGATAELREVYAAAPDEHSQRDVLVTAAASRCHRRLACRRGQQDFARALRGAASWKLSQNTAAAANEQPASAPAESGGVRFPPRVDCC